MSMINRVDNTASITFNGTTINSNTVSTTLMSMPTISKAVDKAVASVGSTLTYTITIRNPGYTVITNLPFRDVIPTGADYVISSFKVNGTAVTPTITGGTLYYTIPSVPAQGSVILQFQVQIIG